MVTVRNAIAAIDNAPVITQVWSAAISATFPSLRKRSLLCAGARSVQIREKRGGHLERVAAEGDVEECSY